MSKQNLLLSLISSFLIITLATAQAVFDPMEIEIQAESGEMTDVVISIFNVGEEFFEWMIPTHPLGGEALDS